MTQPSAASSSLTMLANPRGQAAEAYRTLATNLQFARPGDPIRTVLVTSGSPDDGKTTTLANLGVAAAQAGRRVVLVDCDLRHPSLHTLFNLPNDVGVASVLRGDNPGEELLKPAGIAGLRVLVSGDPAAESFNLLTAESAGRLISSVAKSADLVLIDAPPVTRVADASLLASLVEGVILVVAAMRTRRDHALQAKAQLERVHANILGVIMNNARVSRDAFRY